MTTHESHGARRAWIAAGIAVLIAAFSLGGWYRGESAFRDAGRRQALDGLEPARELLAENASLTRELQSPPYAQGDADFVSGYLALARRDGMVKHSAMKVRIDRLVNNNTSILALLGAYMPRARTAGLKAWTERFREYAIAQRDRWQSVPETFMAGGNLPAAAPALPAQLAEALRAEISAVAGESSAP